MPIQCTRCKQYKGELKCNAFVDKIPEEILTGEFDHTKKYPEQDNDIVFEPINE